MEVKKPQCESYVRLVADVPELGLVANQIGCVRSVWYAPELAYEVKFLTAGRPDWISQKVLVMDCQVELVAEG
jgi:hypothetical protein